MTSPEIAPSTALTPRRKLFFAFCLFLSLMVHGATALVVLFSATSSHPTASIHYIDLAAVSLPATAPPEIHAPVATAEKQAAPEPEALQPREQATQTESATTPAASPEILSTPLGLGMAHGFFKSLGEGRTLREDIRVYYFEILEKINTIWWQKARNLGEAAHQDGIVDISIGLDGALQGARLAGTTGSAEVDRAIIETLREASPFAPPPVSLGQDSFRAPLRIAAPSNLFRRGSN